MATPDVTRSASRDAGPGASLGRPGLFTRLSTETKHALKTTEFWVFLAVLIALLIAGNSIEGEEGGVDRFAADDVWLYATILTVGYMISRGLAKSGSREPYWEQSGQNRERAVDGGRNDADRT